jgi:mannose-6-phosphate isomerase
MYPLLLKPVYKEAVWGGNRMHTLFGRELPSDKTSESWDVSCRPQEMNIVENGPLAGKTFEEALQAFNQKYDRHTFPLLIALIDATRDLSIQVHPGKDESWYIAEAPENASVIIGLKNGVTRQQLETALHAQPNEGAVESLLTYVPVKKGDFIHIPAGVVHALCAGIIVYEVQQNIDITYRLYDYNRPGLDGKPRELHIAQALEIIDFSGNYEARSKHYSVEILTVDGECTMHTGPGTFHTLTVVEGDCTIKTAAHAVRAAVSRSVFVPAGMGGYVINGTCKVLKSTIH